MKVLLIGSGAREHALAWKLSRSELVDRLFAWPGSAALSTVSEAFDFAADGALPGLVLKAKEQAIDFVVVGPEGPLAEGLADLCRAKGVKVFGPCRTAAQLESSKVFAKDIMASAGIPTAAFTTVSSKQDCQTTAEEMLRDKGGVVLKASGLAAGKGVFVCKTATDLKEGIARLYGTDLKAAAEQVVIEELLVGRECSFFTFIGAEGPTTLGFAVDFKRLKDGDEGPNTGGMGCYTPVPWLPVDAAETVNAQVVHPLLAELARRDLDYTGCLYVGLMWTDAGPKVIEFNVRLGDPEAQVLSVHDQRDWAALIAHKLGIGRSRDEFKEEQDLTQGCTVAVVMASAGYPYGSEASAHPLALSHFKNAALSPCVFGAAVKASSSEHLITGKGRILTVVAHGDDFDAARTAAYDKVEELSEGWQGVQFRRDIAARLTNL